MKVIIEKGKVTFPEEIFEKGYLPVNGECEVELMEGWLRIEAGLNSAGRKRMAERLQNISLTLPIDEIAKNEVVEID